MGLYGKIIDLQKLGSAWDHVRKNKPACGVDNVSYEDFENRKKEELKQLNLELAEHRYESLPVKLIDLYKGEKVRKIALFCMRDKVVQQSLANDLGKIYEPLFPPCSYAYRPGQSALQALNLIENRIKQGGTLWVLKMDIANFFDNIDHGILLKELSGRISEHDVLDLLKDILEAKILDEKTGELEKNHKGVFQGASCAPIFSNIYLLDYDREMKNRCGFYVRYSDDILVLEKAEENARETYN
ncbi:MAG: reverse transcriptase/maturase family protein, partial [Lachnospiraceae bacterium]|nr:reverse transcriptase/maturase family protein [Lachnospiraceae bacterium]